MMDYQAEKEVLWYLKLLQYNTRVWQTDTGW